MADTKPDILEILKTYQIAFKTKDVDLFLSNYHPDVRIFDAWEVWSYNGSDAWRGMVTDWFKFTGDDIVAVDPSEVEVISGQDIAVIHAILKFSTYSTKGEELRYLQNRFTFVVKLIDGAWKIVHEHSSSPVDFESQKVILQ